MSLSHPKPRGFTLVEVLLAMMLLGSTGIALLGAFSNSARVVEAPENAAYYLASQQLAALNEAVRQDWWGANGRPLSVNGPAPQPPVEAIGTRTYTPVYAVNTMDTAPADGQEDYRRVRVVVTWP